MEQAVIDGGAESAEVIRLDAEADPHAALQACAGGLVRNYVLGWQDG